MGGIFPISASIEPAKDNPKNITIHGKNITVKGKQPVKLVFHLPNKPAESGYVMLGVAFGANSSNVTVGVHTFPTIKIDRSPTESTMTIADHPQDVGVQHYDYVILVQSIATGEIGIIDPMMVNDVVG